MSCETYSAVIPIDLEAWQAAIDSFKKAIEQLWLDHKETIKRLGEEFTTAIEALSSHLEAQTKPRVNHNQQHINHRHAQNHQARLAQLKKILKVGDYVGCWESKFEKVLTVDEIGFTYGTLCGNLLIPWTARIKDAGYKTYYWLPAELLGAPFTDPIKRARLKEAKEKQ